MSLPLLLTVAVAGGCGAAARYVVDYALTQRASGVFPWGTWAVNVSGAFAAGFLAGLAMTLELPTAATAVVGAGFLGAYTTFSTWMVETLRLVEDGAWRVAAANTAASLAAGLGAGAAGLYLGLLAGAG